MQFNELVDENGTHLHNYVEILQQKAKAHGFTCIFVFAAKSGPNKGIHAVSNIATSVPQALISLGKAMLAVEPEENKMESVIAPPSVH